MKRWKSEQYWTRIGGWKDSKKLNRIVDHWMGHAKIVDRRFKLIIRKVTWGI